MNVCCSTSNEKMTDLIRSITRTTIRDILKMRIAEYSSNNGVKQLSSNELFCFAQEAEEEIHKVAGHKMETYLSKYNSVLYDLQNNIDLVISVTDKSVRAEDLVRQRVVFCCVACGSIAEEYSLFCGTACIEKEAREKMGTAPTPLVPSAAPPIGTGFKPQNTVRVRWHLYAVAIVENHNLYWNCCLQSTHKLENDSRGGGINALTDKKSEKSDTNLYIATMSSDNRKQKSSSKVCQSVDYN